MDQINTDTPHAGSGAVYLSVNLLDPHRLQQVPHHLHPGCSLNRARAASCCHLLRDPAHPSHSEALWFYLPLRTPHSSTRAGAAGQDSRHFVRSQTLAPQLFTPSYAASSMKWSRSFFYSPKIRRKMELRRESAGPADSGIFASKKELRASYHCAVFWSSSWDITGTTFYASLICRNPLSRSCQSS